MYIDILRPIKDAVRRKYPEKLRNKSWLLHDNAPAHRSVLFGDILATNNVRTLGLPPYFPDLQLEDFYLFP